MAWRDGDERARPSYGSVEVVDAVAIEAVLETRAECSDAERARAALSEALLAARAPAHGGRDPRGARSTRPSTPSVPPHWTVTMTVAPSGASQTGTPKSVEAVIMDDAGHIVAQRTIIDRSARACLPLARAVGAWASLVLDAEMNRAKDDDGQTSAALDASSSPSSGRATNSVGRASVGFAGAPPWHDTPRSAGGSIVQSDRADGDLEKAPRSVEIGSMVYLRNGMTRTGGVAGVAPFVTVEVASGWVLRPGLFFGRSTIREESELFSHLGARVDFCRRIPGNYIERRGIEADVCAGVEGGVISKDEKVTESQQTGRLGIGPSANLRGELGAGLALEVRGLLGVHMIQYAALAPLVFASAELGLSVRLP